MLLRQFRAKLHGAWEVAQLTKNLDSVELS